MSAQAVIFTRIVAVDITTLALLIGAAGLGAWFGAGIVACGIGSNLITGELLRAKDYAGIEARVREALRLVGRIKAELQNAGGK